MPKKKSVSTIEAKGVSIAVYTEDFQNGYISLTDIARYKSDEPSAVIANWLRGRETLEFLGLWESLNNPEFKPLEFEGFRDQAGLNSFALSTSRWVSATNAVGLRSKPGRNGGTFAHSDIALEFASWISAEFKLYIIQDYKRLKAEENSRLSLEWNLNREISKLNYRIHTDAIKTHLIPASLTKHQISQTYASEADLLNVAMFGMTAREWRMDNPAKDGNLRDHATIHQLLILANLESYNAILINEKLPQGDRIRKLRSLAESQAKSLADLILLGLSSGLSSEISEQN